MIPRNEHKAIRQSIRTLLKLGKGIGYCIKLLTIHLKTDAEKELHTDYILKTYNKLKDENTNCM